MKFSLIFLHLLFTYLSIAQAPLTNDQIHEDLKIFKSILTNNHPHLYEYTPKKKWNHLFAHFQQQADSLHTSTDLFKYIVKMSDYAKDGHLNILHPPLDSVPAMFPLLLKIIDKEFYTDTEDFDIPIGSKIISINNKSSSKILNALLPYAPSDGFNQTRKYRKIEKEFGILFYYEFGAKNTYTVTYRTPDNKINTTSLVGQSIQNISARFIHRNSHFAAYHKNQDKAQHFRTYIHQQEPFVNYYPNHTAVLTVNSFGLAPQEFKSKLITIFKDLKKKKTSSLIIDLRQNAGGYRVNAIHLYSFLAHAPFKQRIAEHVITQQLIHPEYIKHTLSDYTLFLKNYFRSSTPKNDSLILTVDVAEKMMQPARNKFKGKVYVLTSGKTFSAGAAFALNAKNDSQIVLVGEETGGGYYLHTGQFPVVYELPHSKILIQMSLVGIQHFVNDTSIPHGSGISPDIKISLSPQDLRAGKDKQLDFILQTLIAP